MKKRAIIIASLLAAAGLVWTFAGLGVRSSSEFQMYEQRLSTGDAETADSLLLFLRSRHEDDKAKLSKLSELAKDHVDRAKLFSSRFDSLPPDDKTRSLVFAQRLFMMEARDLYAEYMELCYNTMSKIDNALKSWKQNATALSEFYNQLIYYANLYADDGAGSKDSPARWDALRKEALALQIEHENTFRAGSDMLSQMKVLESKFEERTEKKFSDTMARTLWWKVDPLFSSMTLRMIKVGISRPDLISMSLVFSFAKGLGSIGKSLVAYLATTASDQAVALAFAGAALLIFTLIARYLSNFERMWPDRNTKTIVFFHRFLLKRRLSLSFIVYTLAVWRLTYFPFPDVNIVMSSLYMLLPIWCVMGAVSILLPRCEDNVIFGLMTCKARQKTRAALFTIIWTQLVGWQLLIIMRTYNIGYPYAETIISTLMHLVVFFTLWLGICRDVDNAFINLEPGTRAALKMGVNLFTLAFGLFTLGEIFGYVNFVMMVSYNTWATIAVIALGYVVLSASTLLLAAKWFPELMDFRRNRVSRFALLTVSSAELYEKHRASDLKALAAHAIDFALTVFTGILTVLLIGYIWDINWNWLGKLLAAPCLPYVKGQIPSVQDASISALILFITFWLSRNIKTILTRIFFEPLRYPPAHQYTSTLLVTYLVWVAGIIIALGNLDFGWDKVQWLVAALGVGVGFGLQEIVSNFISGLILLFERPIKVNDYIMLGDLSGVVNDIQIRSTTVRTFNNISVIVPNKDLITKQIVNLTYNDDVIRLNIPVGVAYGADLNKAEKVLLEVADKNRHVLKTPAPTVILKEFADSSIILILRAHIDDARNDFSIQSEINKEIKDRFDANGIGIPFPQRDIHIRR